MTTLILDENSIKTLIMLSTKKRMEYLLRVLLVNARDTPGRLNVVRLGLALTRRAETPETSAGSRLS